MPTRKISTTKNYRLFQRHSSENRPVDLKKHKKLVESMKLYGFLACFPVVVTRNKAGNMIVKDGQHRLMIAEMLGLPVHYVEEEENFDVAIVNSTAKVWQLGDYARKWAANGFKDYADGIEFAEKHSLPVGTAFTLLSGTTTFSNVQESFYSGKWKVKDLAWANAVAAIYSPIVQMNSALKNARFIEACMGVCRVASFKPDRLLQNAKRCREKLVPYSTKDAYLDMLEAVYNFGRKELVGLKSEAVMAMKKRNAVESKRKQPPPTAAAA